jgi:hypothetical protein
MRTLVNNIYNMVGLRSSRQNLEHQGVERGRLTSLDQALDASLTLGLRFISYTKAADGCW